MYLIRLVSTAMKSIKLSLELQDYEAVNSKAMEKAYGAGAVLTLVMPPQGQDPGRPVVTHAQVRV